MHVTGETLDQAGLHAVLKDDANALWPGDTARARVVIQKLKDLHILGKPIAFESGQALGTVRHSRTGIAFLHPHAVDLEGVEGQIVHFGVEEGRAVLDVYQPGQFRRWPPRFPHILRVPYRSAEYTIDLGQLET